MAKPIIIDIETANSFSDVGMYEPTMLDISLVGIYDYETDTYESYLKNELEKLWFRLEKTSCLIGYNSDYFDIPLLNKYYAGDLLQIPSLDILSSIKEIAGKSMKLEDIAQATLGYGKAGDGLKAIKLFKDGKLEELKEYCLSDVKITKKIYEHVKEKGFLKYSTPLEMKQIKITFPEPKQINKINFTLPL